MKKVFLFLLLFVTTLSVHAQFKKGTKYIGASLSGIGLSYSSNQKFRMGIDVSAGFFASDCLMLRGNVTYDHTKAIDDVSLGVAARYYFDQCGVFLGAGADYVHYTPNINDVQIPIEIGYAFFINRYITIEPSIYYKMSLDSFSEKSTVGARIGLGFYF